jgi:predicted ATPase
LWQSSAGNPLFATLLLQHWLEGAPLHAGVASDLSTQLSTQTVPADLSAIITRRLDQLTPAARAVAETAAIAGPIFSLELVREVGGWDEAVVTDAISELLDRRLAHDAGSHHQFDYAFAHTLIQRTLYESIPLERRRSRHRRVGQIMEELYTDRLVEFAAEMALHFDRGGEARRAADYYRQAAQRLIALYADTEALVAIDRALELLPAAATDLAAFELLALREDIHHRRGERAAQQADLLQLEHRAQLAPDPHLICEVHRRQIAYRSVIGERSAQAEQIQQLLRCTDQLGEASWRMLALLAEGQYQILLSAYAQAQVSLTQALQLGRQINDVSAQVAALCALADVAVQQGYFATAQAALAEAQQLAESQTNLSVLITALRATGGALFARQDFAAAQTVAQQMLELCRTTGDREGEADALARLAAVAARLFHITDAQQLYTETEQLYQKLGKRQGQAAIMVNACMLYVGRLGRYAEGLALTRRANSIFCELKDLRGQVVCALNEGLISLYLEDYATSRNASRRGLELAGQIKSQVMEANALANLGAAERELGELDAAIEHMELGLTIRRTLGQPAELGTDLCDLTVAYCRRGDYVAAQRTVSEMLELYTQSQASMMHPQYILWAAAQTYRAVKDAARAQDLLDQAVTVMHRRAADIPETESRPSYYNLPFNRQILAASQQDVWPLLS